MLKGLKVVFVAFKQHSIQSNVTYLTHVERIKSVLCIKWPLAPPNYAIRAHNIFTHYFLNIQLIFNPKKSFGKLRLTPFQPYHQMLCMLKHVEGVESQNTQCKSPHQNTEKV